MHGHQVYDFVWRSHPSLHCYAPIDIKETKRETSSGFPRYRQTTPVRGAVTCERRAFASLFTPLPVRQTVVDGKANKPSQQQSRGSSRGTAKEIGAHATASSANQVVSRSAYLSSSEADCTGSPATVLLRRFVVDCFWSSPVMRGQLWGSRCCSATSAMAVASWP